MMKRITLVEIRHKRHSFALLLSKSALASVDPTNHLDEMSPRFLLIHLGKYNIAPFKNDTKLFSIR
ncbi:MAG: hypothetical protein QXI11_01150 [Thermoproteota archaeon]